MKLLTVIPIARGITKENLTYFSPIDAPIGAVVKVPLRKKSVLAIVVQSQAVAEVKTEIKTADFEMKKIEKVKIDRFLSENFLEAVRDTAEHLITTTGSVLHSTVPKIILESSDKIKIQSNTEKKSPGSNEKLIIQCDDEERYATYKSIIREEFARGHSVFFCLPTIQDIKKAYDRLAKGIENYTFVFHGVLSQKEQIDTWTKACNESHPSLLIVTGSFLGLPRNDIGTIIIDKENSRAYKNTARPFTDIRTFAEILATKIKARIILGDLLLRTETIWRYHGSELYEITPLKFRSLTTAEVKLIDLKEKVETIVTTERENREPKFKPLSQDLLDLIKKNQTQNENLFIFVARRGLSPSTVCSDCGEVVRCNTCDAPTILHKSSVENFFLCHRCGEHRSAMEKCRNCQSWRLAAFGVGLQTVEEEIKNLFPTLKIFKIDSDSVSTHKKAQETAERFYNSPGSILLGTEMALLYLQEKIANTAVVSLDSFFSLPDFRINEKIMNILIRIRAITTRIFLVQTRTAENKIFLYATQGNLADFYRDEIKERQKLFYPPFSLPIKISLTGEKKIVLAQMEQLQDSLKPHELDIFPAFIPGKDGKFCLHGLIRMKGTEQIPPLLVEKLRSLPPQYIVNVDPENFL